MPACILEPGRGPGRARRAGARTGARTRVGPPVREQARTPVPTRTGARTRVRDRVRVRARTYTRDPAHATARLRTSIRVRDPAHMDNDAAVIDAIGALRRWSHQHLAGTVIAIASGKGGVGKTTLAIELAYCLDAALVDLDWDDGSAARALGWRHEDRVRSPLLDALDSGKTPRVISGKSSRPDLVPAGPDLGANQPRPNVLADALTNWSVELARPIVVDTHPGGGDPSRSAAYGAMMAAHVIASPIELGERELDALNGWCVELDGYPIMLVPNRVPRVPPASQLDRLEEIATEYQLASTTPIPDAVWLPRRKARTAVTSGKRLSARSRPMVHALASAAREVADHAARSR